MKLLQTNRTNRIYQLDFKVKRVLIGGFISARQIAADLIPSSMASMGISTRGSLSTRYASSPAASIAGLKTCSYRLSNLPASKGCMTKHIGIECSSPLCTSQPRSAGIVGQRAQWGHGHRSNWGHVSRFSFRFSIYSLHFRQLGVTSPDSGFRSSSYSLHSLPPATVLLLGFGGRDSIPSYFTAHLTGCPDPSGSIWLLP